jgi:hypothetical protein
MTETHACQHSEHMLDTITPHSKKKEEVRGSHMRLEMQQRASTSGFPDGAMIEPCGLNNRALSELLQPEVFLVHGVGPEGIGPGGAVRLAYKPAAKQCLWGCRTRGCELHADAVRKHDVIRIR